ncbi:MAG: asparagine synthase (glutamine-hydrolyzing) [Acidobacteriaceae bacterium]|nr:asparagine synthase (glutamine-hydrolyzing) [Acidobacteriaceae bacterium]
MVSRSWLRAMCDRMFHRGPDGYGEFFDDHVALGHRRLSIIDLSGGAQPLGNEDGSIQIVFNGEIYNYVELQRDLARRGHQFRTKSDTEVIVHLYEEVGERVPEYLNGMFAFAIWDAGKRELFLARDRFGEKPLYYSADIPGTRFCFASELKALTALPGFDPKLNERAVADFLSLSYVPDPHTIYAHVHKLPPGHSLMLRKRALTVRRYWKLNFEAAHSGADPVEEVRSLAADSVQRRMISDVPLGAFLSGGVDSSAVVAMMTGSASHQVKTFSIGFTNRDFDELEYARLIVERYRTEHYEEVVSPSIHDTLGTLSEHFDEPFGDASAIPMLYLSRMTRRHVTVALSGDGADEIFGGYRRYYFGVLEERLRQRFPEWFRKSVIKVGGKYYPKFDYLPQMFRAKTLLTNLAADIGNAYFTSMSTFRDGGLRRVLSPPLRSSLNNYCPRRSFAERFQAVSHLSPLAQMQAVDIETYLPGDILVKTDRTTMAYSLESRPPWLDHRLAELACRLPMSVHLHGRERKHLFKRAMTPLLPEPILTRPKMGFSVPLAEWFRTSLKPVYREAVLQPDMEEYLSLTEARRLWVQHQTGRHDHSRKLWNLLMLGLWHARQRRRSFEPVVEEAVAV